MNNYTASVQKGIAPTYSQCILSFYLVSHERNSNTVLNCKSKAVSHTLPDFISNTNATKNSISINN